MNLLEQIKNKCDMENLERITRVETQVDIIIKDIDEVKCDVRELHSRITTGNREIVEKMDDMQTRLEHKMQAGQMAAQQQHNEIQKEIQQDIKSLSDRVGLLEKWKWYVVGGAVALGWLVSQVMDLTKFVK